MTAATRLLLIEDDPDLASLLTRILQDEGYDVVQAADGRQGLHQLLTGSHEIAILDRGLPGLEGIDLLTQARGKLVDIPVLILSARGTAQDRVDGIEAGAEDYLTKPFDVGELIARLRALMRRRSEKSRWLTFGNLRLDTLERVVADVRSGVVLATLSEREASLLEVLATRPGRLFDRSELRDLVFTDADSDAAVDTYVHYCRKKLGDSVIITVRGFGYRIGSP